MSHNERPGVPGYVDMHAGSRFMKLSGLPRDLNYIVEVLSYESYTLI